MNDIWHFFYPAPPYPLQDFKALYKCCIIIIIIITIIIIK